MNIDYILDMFTERLMHTDIYWPIVEQLEIFTQIKATRWRYNEQYTYLSLDVTHNYSTFTIRW